MLSVIIITRNEEQKIRDCLESVSWADEIVVVDSGSSDATMDICREYTDKVFYQEWKGFGPQKNHALGLATHEWVLSVDADERITGPLKDEILAVIEKSESDQLSAYEIPRRSRFCGRYMKHCGWYPDYVLRLFRREEARFTNDLVHERVVTTGKKGHFKHAMLHLSVENLDQAINKMNLYSSMAAREKFERGESASLLKAISRGGWTFFRVYLLKLGFLDGRQGFMLSVANAGGTYYKYAKLAEFGLGEKGA
ncbi:MAG: glycosyltransferase [Gammaproteobacteria bacterium]|nr:glycosyltransferase [Gammaproteobacteria bacterium]